jgi:hypothetical protein
VARVFVVNVILAALALTTILLPWRMTAIAAMTAGAALVASLLRAFASGVKHSLKIDHS